MKYTCDYCSVKHKRNLNKPSEDIVYIDSERGIFILLDGVTRPHSEYDEAPDESAVCEVNKIFVSSVTEYLNHHANDEDAEAALRGAVRLGNEKISEYRKIKSQSEWGYYPGTLGIIAILRGSRLYYLSAGDCVGALIRSGSKLFFGTEMALDAISLNKPTKEVRYKLYCNHPENPLSYTIYNGDAGVESTACFSFIDLAFGDFVILASDGISSLVKYEKASALVNMSAEQMIAESEKFDTPPYADYADDKSIVTVRF